MRSSSLRRLANGTSLHEMESQADEIVVERMRQIIADALSRYKPMREECDVAMERHHSYERTLITKYGEMRLGIPVFRCGAMRGGMEVIGKGQTRKLYSNKICDEAMRLATLGVSYERVGKMLGLAKSTLCKWLKQERYKRPKMSGEVLELGGVWTRVAGGNVELKVARDERGVAVASAGSWEDVLASVRDLGASAPRHIVSDGDRAIECAISMAYGRGTPHQLNTRMSCGVREVSFERIHRSCQASQFGGKRTRYRSDIYFEAAL